MVKNANQPLTWKWAASSLQKDKQKQQQEHRRKGLSPGFSSNFSESQLSLNYDSDYATAETIYNEIKKEILNRSTSQFSASDVEI